MLAALRFFKPLIFFLLSAAIHYYLTQSIWTRQINVLDPTGKSDDSSSKSVKLIAAQVEFNQESAEFDIKRQAPGRNQDKTSSLELKTATDAMDAGQFLPAEQLDRVPEPYELIEVPIVNKLGIQGSFIFVLYIDENGFPLDMRPLDQSIPRKIVDTVIKTFLSSRYTPGIYKGNAVKSQLKIIVDFDQPAR